jgi:hypothetical protein
MLLSRAKANVGTSFEDILLVSPSQKRFSFKDEEVFFFQQVIVGWARLMAWKKLFKLHPKVGSSSRVAKRFDATPKAFPLMNNYPFNYLLLEH